MITELPVLNIVRPFAAIPGKVAWFDASDRASHILDSSGNVAMIRDKFGLGRDAYQENPANRLTLEFGSQNGLPGFNRMAATSAMNFDCPTLENGYTIFAVYRQSANTTTWFGLNGAGANDTGVRCINVQLRTGNAGTTCSFPSGTPGAGSMIGAQITFDGVRSPGTTHTIRTNYNGTAVARSATQAAGTPAAGVATFMNQAAGTSAAFDDDFYEFMLFRRALPDSMLADLRAYSARKWGIAWS